MKVKELIKVLSNLPEEMEVVLERRPDDDYEAIPVINAEVDYIKVGEHLCHGDECGMCEIDGYCVHDDRVRDDLEEHVVLKLNEEYEEIRSTRENRNYYWYNDRNNDKGDKMEEKSTIDLCNEIVNAVENGTQDDFLASYLELTKSLKAEVLEDIQNEEEETMKDEENIYSEMTYGDNTIRVLCDGRYNGIKFWIMNVRGSHPCGYIEVPEDHPYYNLTYQEGAMLPVHGGVTFSEDHLSGIAEDTWILGWDYGHSGDKTLYFEGERHYVADIIDEIKEAINFLIEQ